ncbi:hypothetical protein D3C85_1940560 [compost metagenome]
MACGIQVDQVQPARTQSGMAHRHLERPFLVAGLALEIALVQPHGVAFAHVDGRVQVEFHAGHR